MNARLKPIQVDQARWAGGKQSPTLASYTDWRRIAAGLKLPPADIPSLSPTARELGLEGLVVSPGSLKGGPGKGWRVEHNVEIKSEAANMAEKLHYEKKPVSIRLAGGDRGEGRVHLLGGEGHAAYHLEIVVEEPGETVLLLHLDAPATGSISLTMEARLAPHAKLKLYTLSTVQGVLYHRLHASLAESSRLESRRLTLPAWGAAYSSTVKLGNRAYFEAYSATIAHGDSWMDEDEGALHLGGYSGSLIRLRGTSSGGATLSSRGRVTITKDAAWSSGDLEASLYEFEGSKAYSLPVLEVYTGDVSLGRHSALVTSIRGDEAFYLRQRGLRPEDLPALYAVGLAEWSQVPDAMGLPLGTVEELFRS